jgi:hypothetical protein
MKITKITFEQLFPTGQYANQRLGVEIAAEDRDIGYGDSEETFVKKAFAKGKDLVEKAFKEMNPELKAISGQTMTDYNTGEPHLSNIAYKTWQDKQTPPPVIDRGKETMKEIIQDCKTPLELEQLVPESIAKYCLQEEYNQRYKEVS